MGSDRNDSAPESIIKPIGTFTCSKRALIRFLGVLRQKVSGPAKMGIIRSGRP